MSKKFIENLIIAFLLIIGFIFRWSAYNQTDFATGWDTYYYLIQIKSYLSSGKMHSPEWNLFYPLLLLFNTLLEDPVLASKWLFSFLTCFVALSFFLLAKALKSPYPVSLFIVVLINMSPSLTYYAAQWGKNLVGVIIYMFLIIGIRKESVTQVCLLLILGFFAHRMTAVLSIITLLVWLLNKRTSSRFKWILLLSMIVGTTIVNFLPGLLSFNDIDRFTNLFNQGPQIPQISFYRLFGAEKISVWWIGELTLTILSIIFFVFILIRRLINKQKISSLEFSVLFVFFVLWFPFFNLSTDNIPYRLFHTGLILYPVLLLFSLNKSLFPYKLLYIPSVVIFCISFYSWRSYNPTKHDPDYRFYYQMSEKLENHWEKFDKPELIIGHKSMAELITYQTEIDVLPWRPEYHIAKDKLYRIAYLPFNKLYSYYIKQEPFHLGKNYFYIKESNWQKYISNLRNNETKELLEQHLGWKNPHQIRPKYLLKN
jgi:hypothetical protein